MSGCLGCWRALGICKSATSSAIWVWVARGFLFVDPHVFILTVQTWPPRHLPLIFGKSYS